MTECVAPHGPFSVVVNTAALSQPAECEKNPALARAVNVPRALVHALKQQLNDTAVEAFLIHISTDQVYDGSRANWTEDCDMAPVNAYGESKKEAELFLRAEWPRHVSLRSSIIYGPQPRVPVSRPLLLQWMANVVRNATPTNFFSDQYRNPIYVLDIVNVVDRLTADPDIVKGHSCLNMGGPERMSRVDIAHAVAAHLRLPTECILSVPVSSVSLAVASPDDISMDSTKLFSLLTVAAKPLREALGDLFPTSE